MAVFMLYFYNLECQE